MIPRIAALLALWATLLIGPAFAEQNCPSFLASREPAPNSSLRPPATWSATDNVHWKTEIPGLAWSSPIVWGNRVFITTCVNEGETAEPRKGLYLEDVDANKYPKDTAKRIWKVCCLDLNTGKFQWQQTAHEGVPARPHHIKNTLASETPTTDGRRVYALFGNVGLFCYDLDGHPLWQQLFEPHDTQMGWGTSISPVVHGDRVFVVNDNEEQSRLLAFDAATGKEVWHVDREEKTNYATPFVWPNELRTELVTSGIGWARSYDLDGQLLWQLKGLSILAVPTPFARFGNLYLTSGHVVWGANPMYAIRPGAKGDISPNPEGQGPLNESLLWYQPKAGPYHPTPLILGEQMYVLYDRGLMASWNAKTGAEIYPRKRIPGGRAFTASPWTDGTNVFCINEDGVTFVVRPGAEFEILYTNKLEDDDMCMATPVVVDDKLLIRTSARIYCLRQSGDVRASR